MKSPGNLLIKQTSSQTLGHISLAFAGVMWVLPFLNYYHAYPLTTFYQEWGAVVLGLAATTLLLTKGYWQKAEVPHSVLLPIALLLLVVVQYALGKIPYFGQMLLYALYLMWMALLIMLGARLREELGLPAVATVLATFLLIGAELNAAIGIYQHFQWHSILDHVVTQKISAAVFGNVAQPNHYADYLALGLASLGLLYARGSLRAWLAVLLALPILFVLPLSGSRGTWFYLAWFFGSAYLWQRREPGQRALLYYSLLTLLGFGLMHLVIQLSWLTGHTSNVNSVQRMFTESVSSGSIRLYLWHEAWLIFTRFPLLGAGFGQYAWQHFQLAPSLHNTGITGLYNNAHNLVMQLAAEGGLAGLLVLLMTLLPWLRQAQRDQHSIYQWWGCALLGVLVLHSLLEYPLWYAYFLGIAALTLGMLDASRYRLELHRAGRVLLLLILLFGVLSLQQLMTGYRRIEGLLVMRLQSGNNADYLARMRSGLAVVQGETLLQPYADLYTSSMIEIGPENLADKLRLNGEVMHFVPASEVVYRQSLLLAQEGDLEAAQVQMERAIWSYPSDFPAEEEKLSKLGRKDATRYAALLKFAIQKFEEYQSAVHAK